MESLPQNLNLGIILKAFSHAFNPFHSGNLQTGTLANSEDPDEMPHKAAFHLSLHCLPKYQQSSGTEIYRFIEILSANTSCEMGNSIPVLSTCMEKSIRKKRVELFVDIGNYE